MAFNAEQLAQLNILIGESIRRGLTEGLAAAPTPTQKDDKEDHRRILDEKNFKRLENFKGEEKGWKDWAKKFKVVIGTKDKRFMKAMERAESTGDPCTTSSIGLEDDFVNFDQGRMETLSAELYDILFMLTDEEAMSLVQSVPDMDGLAAWQKLHGNYNPKTLARLMQKIMMVVSPPKIQDVKTVVTMVEEWEKRIKELESDTQEKISDVFKMAIMTGMMPVTLQEYIFQQADDSVNYKKSRDKVIALANNRVTMQQGPVPMDIGNVGHEGYWGDHGDQMEYEIDYADVNMKCHRCGGFGHAVRQCPSEAKGGGKGFGQKGGGKGDSPKGFGKDGGKSSWNKGFGKGQQQPIYPKGKGKGYQGTCWKCGKVGHKSVECWNHKAFNVEEDAEEPREDVEAQEGNVDSVWLVAGVETKMVNPPGLKRAGVIHPGPKRAGVKTRNQFGVLAERRGQINAVETTQEEEQAGGGLSMPRGRRQINAVEKAPQQKPRKCGMIFHMTDAKRMLASVDKIVEAGHKVHFGKEAKESFIEHNATGEKIFMQRENGVFVVRANIDVGDKKKKATIVIDSGASECVMPKQWLEELPKMKAAAGIRFTCAKGNDMGNYGRKLVEFMPIFTRPA